MQYEFRVVDVSSGSVDPVSKIVAATSPEAAASEVFGTQLVRSGAPKDLVARVYWQPPGSPTNMVRLYRKVEGTRVR